MRKLLLISVVCTLNATMAQAQIANPGPTDPSAVLRYPKTCSDESDDLRFGPVRGLAYYPRGAGGCDTSVYSPLVIILRGNGYNYTRYEYLQKHLAQNGFITVSVDVVSKSDDDPTAHESAAEQVETYLRALWNNWALMPYINPRQIALVGHSRGGETIRYLATRLFDDLVFRTRAVISIAGTGDTHHFVTGEDAVGYLGIGGTFDSDVPPWQVYRQYDLAGQPGSQLDPDADERTLYRGLKILAGASHSDFTNGGGLGATVRRTTQGYVLAFLAAHLQNNPEWYEPYIRDDWVPGTFAGAVLSQTRDGFLRRTVDNFEDGDVSPNTLGGNVATFKAVASVISLAYEDWTAHETWALWMRGLRTNSSVTWMIPRGKNDASSFKYLQFRLAQDGGSPRNDLMVQVRNRQWSDELRVSDYGTIAQPTSFACGAVACPSPSLQMTNMQTIRIPLSAFGSSDNITAVRFRFRGDSANTFFLLDDLEFSEFILKP